MVKFFATRSTLATIGSLLLASKHVNAQDYDDLPDGVVHFPLTRVSGSTPHDIYKHDSNNKTVDAALARSDLLFTTKLQIGSNKQNVTVVIDTSSSDLLLLDTSNPYCLGNSDFNISSSDQIECRSDAMFDSNSSSTFHFNQTNFTVASNEDIYATGSFATDTIIIGGKTISNASFALISDAEVSWNSSLGIGLMQGESSYYRDEEDDDILNSIYPNIPVQMKEQGLISHIAYSFWLNDVHSQEGNLLFGGVDHAKYQGSLQKVPIINFDDTYTLSVLLGNISLYQGSDSEVLAEINQAVLLDSGYANIGLPYSIVTAIKNSVGVQRSHDIDHLGDFLVACDVTGGFTFNIGGIEIQIPFSEITTPLDDNSTLCRIGIDYSFDQIVLGDSFLRNVYTVFDLENLEVALAPAVFNTTDSDVEAITTGIPSASQAPHYSSTNIARTIVTHSVTFFKTGAAGEKYGEYPSGYTETATFAPRVTGESNSTSLDSSSAAASSGTHSNSSSGTHATRSSSSGAHVTSASSSGTSSTSKSSKSKNGAPRDGAEVGILGAIAGCVFMLF